jgi:uncharacterized protein YndB with AHSA1/START domain
MKENKITVVINKSIGEVFEFTTNPKNTHTWIPSIEEEISEQYPPKIGTIYKNRGKEPNWDTYKVVEFEKDTKFTLTDLDNNYSVTYTYRKIDNSKTEMEYFEWVRTGDLEKPFTQPILDKLKEVME